jgi:hypothetical protein
MRIICIALAVAATPFIAATRSDAQGLRDKSSRPPPSLTLPAARGSYTDPVFGTKIIRVTDARDGNKCTHAYSYWPAFNSDGTRLMLACDDQIRLYRFDPATDTLTPDGLLRGDDGYKVQFDGATWSQSTSAPSTVYAVDAAGTRLWRIVVSKRGLRGYTLLKDFGPWIPGRTVHHLTVSNGGDVYTVYTRDKATGAPREVLVWERYIDKLRVFPKPSGKVINEAQVNRDGDRVLVNYDDGDCALWDFRNGTVKSYALSSATDNVAGHFDVGRDFIANSDGVNAGIVVRTYGATRSPENVVTYTRPDGRRNWSIADHVSLRAHEEEWVTVSTYAGDGTWAAFEDEIFMARTDGTGFVRLAHTRSRGVNANPDLRYFSQPRAVVDRRGRYIVFTSDLGSTTRFDVLIVKVPSAYWPG